MNNNSTIVKLAIDSLVPNKYQPRKYFDDASLNELANSIKNYGIINPILVRQKDNKYEIIAGERRFRAAKMCGLQEVPVIIKDANEQQMAELALIENLARQDLTAIETARAYEEIIKMGNHTQNEIATKLGKSQATIANKIRLLSLPMEVQEAVINKKISERHARCLLSIKDKNKQLELLERIISEKLTVKETEEIASMQNINEEDIQQAINDIMKSLSIKEEEKEDEKMNNGNFFPNYDNNMGQNNNISLNSLNSMPQFGPNITQSTPPEQEFVLPTTNAQPTMQQPEIPNYNINNNNSAPMMPPAGEELLFTQPQTYQQPTPMMDAPLFNQNLNQMPSDMPQNNDFQNPIQPMNFQQSEPMAFNQEPARSAPIPPLFEQNINPTMTLEEPINNPQFTSPNMEMSSPMNSNPVLEPVYEPSVMTPSPIESTPLPNRLEEVKTLLDNNGIGYKAYSNESGHCIIIEL